MVVVGGGSVLVVVVVEPFYVVRLHDDGDRLVSMLTLCTAYVDRCATCVQFVYHLC